MNDGIIKGEGNSRFLKTVADFLSKYPTYEAFARAFMEGTLPIDLNGINDAGWDQLPTWLNKKNLLEDLTAAIYNKGVDATPNEVLEAIFAVGDIKVSTRTDLGDNWLLCNGATFSASKYPELAKLCSKKASEWQKVSLNFPSASSESSYDSYCYCNGYWFLARNVAGWKFYYSENFNGPWKLASLETTDFAPADKVFFGKGKYIGFSYNGYVSYAVSPAGPWKKVKTDFSPSFPRWDMTDAALASNRFMVLVKNREGSDQVIAFKDDIVSGAWGIINCPQSSYEMMLEASGQSAAIVQFSTSSSSPKSAFYSNNILNSSPSFSTTTSLTVGKVSEGWLFGGANIDLQNPLGTKIKTIAQNSNVKGKASETSDFYIISQADGTVKVISKNPLEDCGNIKAGGSNVWNDNYSKAYTVSGNKRLVRVVTNLGKMTGEAYTATNEELALPVLPTISINNAYCYMRGK